MSLGFICMIVIGLTGCNSQKKYVKVSSIDSNGYKEEWTYNKDGKETGYFRYNSDGKMLDRHEVYYSEDGNKETRYCYQDWFEEGDMKLNAHVEYYYKDGEIIKWIEYDVDRVAPDYFPKTSTYQYDEKAHQVKRTTVDNFGEEILISTADYYNNEFFWKTEMWAEDDRYELKSENEFEFDEKGNIIKYINIDVEDGEINEDVRYEYDENGNRIQVIENSFYYENNEKVNQTTTTYYEYQLLSDYLKEHPQE